MPVRRMLSTVPSPSDVVSTMPARHASLRAEEEWLRPRAGTGRCIPPDGSEVLGFSRISERDWF